MTEKENKVEVVDNNSVKSSLIFDEQVISKIVIMALKDVEGMALARSSSGGLSGFVGRGGNSAINVEVGETEVAVDLRLILEFGKNAKELYENVKTAIETQVNNMTGLKVVEVNAKIEDVLSPEEFEERLNA